MAGAPDCFVVCVFRVALTIRSRRPRLDRRSVCLRVCGLAGLGAGDVRSGRRCGEGLWILSARRAGRDSRGWTPSFRLKGGRPPPAPEVRCHVAPRDIFPEGGRRVYEDPPGRKRTAADCRVRRKWGGRRPAAETAQDKWHPGRSCLENRFTPSPMKVSSKSTTGDGTSDSRT